MINKNYNLDSYLNYFTGREDFVAVQGKDYYYPIKCKLDERIVTKHIDGIETFGVYVLSRQSQCNFICIDIDIEKNELSNVGFSDAQKKFDYLKDKLLKCRELFENVLFISKNILYEDSGGRGYHIWIFFDKPIEGHKALYLNDIFKNKLDFSFEFFPKQPTLNEKRKYGNLIKLPLGVHKKYNQRSKFFTINNTGIDMIEGVDENISHLVNIVKVKSEQVEEIIKKYTTIIKYDTEPLIQEQYESNERLIFKKNYTRLYSQCDAINRLRNKALSGGNLKHIEIFHLSNTLLSVQDSKDDIHNLIKSSIKEKYSYEITEKELELIAPLKPANCKTLIKHGICTGYCKEEFKNKSKDQFLSNTSPLYSLTPINTIKKIKASSNLLEKISNPDNIRLAYYRLREYHKNEDVLFFDEFDFDFFEKDFDINIQQISIVIKNKIEIPFIEYEKVKIPKKLDENGNMVYRPIVYSSVFDQIIIQAIFNVIGEIFERNFEENSYGYRLDVENYKSHKIFEDWRKKYPEFRNTVLNRLREPNIKYYICCDIKGYYDNIKKDILISKLRTIIDDDYVFSLIKKSIESYSFNDAEGSDLGLPQGPAYARPLSNLYLNKFDKEIKDKANYYFRYVDDFYLLFDDLDKANKVKELVVNKLGELGLRLADGEDKEANIIEAYDESKLQDKIDSVRYGLFEDFKFLPNLSKQHIESFYDTIIRKTYTANEKNKEIPTLIYFATSSNIDDERRKLIIDIVEELAKENAFFPKKVKNLFSRLLDIYENLNKDFAPFFNLLEDTNKTYFLLALYEKYKEDNTNKYTDKLKQILEASLASEDKFFLGFGLMINFNNPELIDFKTEQEFIAKINSYKSAFLGSKLYRSINYFDQSNSIQREIDNYFKTSTNYLIKKVFLFGVRKLDTVREVDNELFHRILSDNYYFLHSDCCKIISLIKSKNALLNILIGFIEREKPKYNTFIPDLLGNKILSEYKESDNRDLDNLRLLFDDKVIEIQNIIDQTINRIKNTYRASSISYIDKYNLVDAYNDCSYYASNDDKEKYREIIPFKDAIWYEELTTHINLLQEKSIAPKTDIQYDSGQSIVVLSSWVLLSNKEVSDFCFSLNNDQECFNLLSLANNIYKKALKYYKITGKIPLIEKENIKIIDANFDIVFLKKGKDLSSQYFCNNEKIDSSTPENILKLLHNFVFSILFQTITKLNKFTDPTTPKVGIQLFVDYIIKRLKSEKLSVEKFDYLYRLIEKEEIENKKVISYIYFSEKLKSNIFKNCEHYLNWKGITNGILELYEDFALTYKKIDFSKIKYKYKLFLNNDFPSDLHPLSKIIINFNLNLNDILADFNEDFHFKYFQFLNFFGVYCLEIHSLFKFILLNNKKIESLSSQLSIIEYDGAQIKLFENEIHSINRLIKVYNSAENYVFKNSSPYTLKEMGVLCLLVYFKHNLERDRILIQKSNKRRDEDLLNLLINHNPKIEKVVCQFISLVNDSLKNHYRQPDISLEILQREKEAIINMLFLIRKILKKHNIKRGKNNFRIAINNKEFELGRSSNKSPKKVSVLKTYNNPFTDTNYNFEKEGKLYCESKKGKVFNIIIPDKRIITIHENLKRGKPFGYKIPFFYHNKGRLICDIFILLIFGILYAYLFTLDLKGFKSGILELFKKILWLPFGVLVVKCFHDLRYWIRRFDSFLRKFKNND